jgi:hypothetical protein
VGIDNVTYVGEIQQVDHFTRKLNSQNTLLETAVGVVPKMAVDDAQSGFSNLLDDNCGQRMHRLIPLSDEGNDIVLLYFERIVVR